MKPMILASGLQSGGTTLVSSAFLKHPDVDGVLDMASDRIETNLSRVVADITWVKMTSISFSWQEVEEIYRLSGYQVYPLLIVRNPFDAWASLKNKWYGLNSTTAEDPPLVLRFRRFLNDWQWFVKNGHPVIQFEKFISNPEQTLKRACEMLPIDFHPAMLDTHTDLSEIAYVSESNASFVDSLEKGISSQIATQARSLDETEYAWINDNMSELLAYYQYENSHSVGAASLHQGVTPQPFDSRRYLGFGPQAAGKRVSSKLPQILAASDKARGEGRDVLIYGACEFGEYLADFLSQNARPIAGFIDSFAENNSGYAGYPLNKRGQPAPDALIIVASFRHAKEIKQQLLAADISSLNIITFGEGV